MKEETKKECKHLHTICLGSNRISYGTCQDCGLEVRLDIVFNNWIKEFEKWEKKLYN